jgi:hypothetical protein
MAHVPTAITPRARTHLLFWILALAVTGAAPVLAGAASGVAGATLAIAGAVLVLGFRFLLIVVLVPGIIVVDGAAVQGAHGAIVVAVQLLLSCISMH